MDHTTPDNLGNGDSYIDANFPEESVFHVPPLSRFEIEVAREGIDTFIKTMSQVFNIEFGKVLLGMYADHFFGGDLEKALYFLHLQNEEGKAFVLIDTYSQYLDYRNVCIIYIPRENISEFIDLATRLGATQQAEMAAKWSSRIEEHIPENDENEG